MADTDAPSGEPGHESSDVPWLKMSYFTYPKFTHWTTTSRPYTRHQSFGKMWGIETQANRSSIFIRNPISAHTGTCDLIPTNKLDPGCTPAAWGFTSSEKFAKCCLEDLRRRFVGFSVFISIYYLHKMMDLIVTLSYMHKLYFGHFKYIISWVPSFPQAPPPC